MANPPKSFRSWLLPSEFGKTYQFFIDTPLSDLCFEGFLNSKPTAQNGHNQSLNQDLIREYNNAMIAIINNTQNLHREIKSYGVGHEQVPPEAQPVFHINAPNGIGVVVCGTAEVNNDGERSGRSSQARDDDQENQATKHSYEDEVHELPVIDDDGDDLWPPEDYENSDDPSVAQEEDENDPDPRSDLTYDYHPTRTIEYTLENVELDDNAYEELFTNTECASSPTDIEATHYQDTWIVNRFNVVNALKSFRTLSSSLNPRNYLIYVYCNVNTVAKVYQEGFC
ncbi:hypothetical protein BDA99DRAFT_567032 [Phascolomyces articulosus]|uniref:Uncharacterized protein n=1 Tax=Phascolomyces articulosus TaxID=60185 RepID=A0AAD5KBH3_9FUNG|nr:hypothetical protein BDA99DRAFT_567032 [Phascolomyces articulosus]